MRIACTGSVRALSGIRSIPFTTPIDVDDEDDDGYKYVQAEDSHGASGQVRAVWARRAALSDDGSVVIHIEEVQSNSQTQVLFAENEKERKAEVDNYGHVHRRHSLVAYSLSGCRTGLASSGDLTCSSVIRSAITFLSCPDRGQVVVCGQQDGSVCFLQSSSLSVLFKFKPHLCCTTSNSPFSPPAKNNNTNNNKNNNNLNNNINSNINHSAESNSKGTSLSESDTQNLSVPSSPIIFVSVGPDRLSPAVLCAVSESGNLFFRALPDFYKWEKNRLGHFICMSHSKF